MAVQERFVTFLTPLWWQYHLLAFVAVASMLSILTVYLWRRDLLAIDETRYSAPTYKVVYLRQYVFISRSHKATRPERSTDSTNAVAAVIVAILTKYIYPVLSPLFGRVWSVRTQRCDIALQ
jgi:hypothetical protein